MKHQKAARKSTARARDRHALLAQLKNIQEQRDSTLSDPKSESATAEGPIESDISTNVSHLEPNAGAEEDNSVENVVSNNRFEFNFLTIEPQPNQSSQA